MVGQVLNKSSLIPEEIELPKENVQWSSVKLQEAVSKEFRLKASVFGIEGRHARESLDKCKWDLTRLVGPDGLADASYPNRFKRVWVDHSDYPIFQPAQINDINPKPTGYISELTQTNFDALRSVSGQILMTRSGRSGSIGRTSFVSETSSNRIFSDDLIRITCKEEGVAGFVYAFLNTKTGRALVKTNEYGAMIPHIEPHHLQSIPIPNPQPVLRKRIHDLIVESYSCRDKANMLLAEAQANLLDNLKLKPLRDVQPDGPEGDILLDNYSVKLSSVLGRFDAVFHRPVIRYISQTLFDNSKEVTFVGDSRISKQVVLPGRFARVYVEEGQGVPFFGGKQIHQLDPTDRKFLSLKIHGARIRSQLTIEEHMTLITCSGTIGKVALAPKHWDGLAASQHIIRIIPASEDVAGFIYVFLATDHGRELIKRYSYGSAVGEINAQHVSQVQIPFLNDTKAQCKINRLALEASDKLAEAYRLERKAIRITNDEVISIQAK
jgi:type I restriction enzyme S subunit